MSKERVKAADLNVFLDLVQASKTYIKVPRTQRMQALLIFFLSFFLSQLCGSFLYAHASFFYFVSFKCCKNKIQLRTITNHSFATSKFCTKTSHKDLTLVTNSNSKTYNCDIVDLLFLFNLSIRNTVFR